MFDTLQRRDPTLTIVTDVTLYCVVEDECLDVGGRRWRRVTPHVRARGFVGNLGTITRRLGRLYIEQHHIWS